MTNILLVLVTVSFLIQDVFSNEALLAKFHQHGYKIKDVRIEVVSYDPNVFNFLKIKPFKCNRTTTAHNASLNAKVNLKDDIEVVIQVYKFLSNEYRHFPIRFQVNLKKALDANVAGLQDTLKCGNLSDFYFCKDITYHVCNFCIDESRFPPLIPSGKYKADCQALYFNKEIAMLNLYGEVYTPIEYPKK